MKKYYSFLRSVAAVLALAVLGLQGAQAQKLQVNELLSLQTKSVEEIRASLESKGWLYDGNCGGDETPRHCFKIGDGGTSLAAVLYVEGDGVGEQAIEYTVFRKGLISQLQSSLRAAAMKLTRQDPIAPNVKLRIYEKNGKVAVARGGLEQNYYSLKIQPKPAFERMQASR
ncbi:hypothetical protein [Rufibacter sp. LB8]|uniref:hypothetical protein n=1 Tax=Rufibacter sp. LB8 TaxID=2777781 RepID=UPI00178C2DAD|nr:hypothetical protein [Rufibacter sp. LB8]